jgi:hypothetical protein
MLYATQDVLMLLNDRCLHNFAHPFLRLWYGFIFNEDGSVVLAEASWYHPKDE